MSVKKIQIMLLFTFTIFISACVYIVLPEGLESPGDVGEAGFWTAIVTNIGESESGDLQIDLTIRNDTGDWSTMQAAPDQAAVLTKSDGTSTNCITVNIGTGGHRVAPGFQVRGYLSGDDDQPETQLLYVVCEASTLEAGSILTIDYGYSNGELDYYTEETNQVEGTLEINLDEVVTDLTYPVATPVEGLVLSADVEITALSDNIISLLDVQRDETGFQFTWQNHNPSKFPLKTHIGIPPVIGDDGVIYGLFETQDMSDVPLTPAQASVEWTTSVAVPLDVGNLYILLSVESNKPRTYLNYAIDITDK